MIKIVFIVLAFSLLNSISFAATLIEDKKGAVYSRIETSSSALELRKLKRVGVGFNFGGYSGAVGTNIELNFTPNTSLVTGFGTGGSYQTFSFQWRNTFSGQWLVPYTAIGYSHWYTVGNPDHSIERTTPAFLADRFLSEQEKLSGRFEIDLLTPTFGIQYVQLSGPWIGSSVFAELTLLLDINDMVTAPTGSVGYRYYF